MNTTDDGPGRASAEPIEPDPLRTVARKRLEARREFSSHLTAYLVINAFLVGTWAVTGAGYFRPGWVIGAWGASLALHAWELFARRAITEADIDAEVPATEPTPALRAGWVRPTTPRSMHPSAIVRTDGSSLAAERRNRRFVTGSVVK